MFQNHIWTSKILYLDNEPISWSLPGSCSFNIPAVKKKIVTQCFGNMEDLKKPPNPLFPYNLPLLSDVKTCCFNCDNFGCGGLSGFGEECKNVKS